MQNDGVSTLNCYLDRSRGRDWRKDSGNLLPATPVAIAASHGRRRAREEASVSRKTNETTRELAGRLFFLLAPVSSPVARRRQKKKTRQAAGERRRLEPG